MNNLLPQVPSIITHAFENKKFWIILLILSIFYFLFSLIGRQAHIDDYWLGEYAYWFSKVNYVKSELMRGYFQYDKKLLIYHKLFILLGGLVIKFSGYHLYSIKAVSLPFLGLSVFLSKKIIARWNFISDKNFLLIIFLCLFIIEPHIFEFSFVFRPEVMLMSIGLSIYYFTEKSVATNESKYAFMVGVLSGLAFLTHLNGIVFLVAALFIFIHHKQYKFTVYLIVSFSIIAVFYFWDVSSIADLNLLLTQFKNDPALDESDFHWYTYIVHLLKEHERFFHSPGEIFVTSVFIISLFLNWSFLKKNLRIFLQFYLCTILILALICYGKTPKYMIIYMPFLCLIISFCIYHIIRDQKWKYLIFPIFLYFISSLFINSTFCNIDAINFLSNTPKVKDDWKIEDFNISKGEKVLAPISFTFPHTMEFQLQCHHVYRFFQKKDIFPGYDYLTIAALLSNKYIFLDPETREMNNITMATIENSHYSMIRKNDYWTILMLKEKR